MAIQVLDTVRCCPVEVTGQRLSFIQHASGNDPGKGLPDPTGHGTSSQSWPPSCANSSPARKNYQCSPRYHRSVRIGRLIALNRDKKAAEAKRETALLETHMDERNLELAVEGKTVRMDEACTRHAQSFLVLVFLDRGHQLQSRRPSSKLFETLRGMLLGKFCRFVLALVHHMHGS
eukprot:6467793-Amphidinium_carterae.1